MIGLNSNAISIQEKKAELEMLKLQLFGNELDQLAQWYSAQTPVAAQP